MSFEHSIRRGVLYGFVPHRLEIEGRPELNIFPFNVLFMQWKVENGQTIAGSAVYEPDLVSFKQDGIKYSMYYHNAYGGKNWLIIEYDSTKQSYIGTKFVNEKEVGMAFGSKWKMFFVHFTSLGLVNGERCEFKSIEKQIKEAD